MKTKPTKVIPFEYDEHNTDENTITPKEFAVIAKEKGVKTTERKFYQYLRDNGYVHSDKNSRRYNLPTAMALDLGVLGYRQKSREGINGFCQLTTTTRVTVKGQQYFLNKLLEKTN